MEYPRVTEVLRPFTSYDSVPQDILKRAAARGTSVHAICAGLAKGAWIPDAMIPEDLVGYVTSFRLWADAQVKSFEIIEKRYIDEQLLYTGQLDFVVKGTDGELYLVDLKTSARPQKTYPVQMAAYDCLLRGDGTRVKGAMLVYLKKDGDFPDVDLIEDLTEELDVFLYALHCWKFFNRRKPHVRKQANTEESAPADSGSDE